MANTMTQIMPKILARGLLALRSRCIMPRLVNTEYGNDPKKKGSTVDIPISTAIAAINVTPSSTPIVPTDKKQDLVQVVLDQWVQNTPFYLTDKELTQVDKDEHFLPMNASEAISGIADRVNADIFAAYTDVGNLVNAAGTTVVKEDIISARTLLHKSKCPQRNRAFVVNFDAEGDLLAIPEFASFNVAGQTGEGTLVEGDLGRRYGFHFMADDATPLHTGGTSLGVGTPLINGTFAIGDRVIGIDGVLVGATTLLAGDSFTIAGDSTYYSVTAANTAAVGVHSAVSISPALKVAPADNAAVTFIDATAGSTGRTGLAFHRDAFAFATRPLETSSSDLAMANGNLMTMTDPVTGLSLRLEITRQHKQTVWEFDILYGVKCVRPEFACKVYTGTT